MVVARPTYTTTAGTTTTTYAAHLSSVQCVWKRTSGQEAEQFGAMRVRRQWETEIDNGADVRRGDRCTFTDKTGTHVVYVIDTAETDDGESIALEAEELT